MSDVVSAVVQLETHLREEGYKGTQRAMRLLKALRIALEAGGYSFDAAQTDSSKK